MTIQEERKPITHKRAISGKSSQKTRRLPSHKPSPSAVLAKKIFIVFLFLIAQTLFYYSDFFKLQHIKVYGNRMVSSDKILQVADIPMDHNIVTLPMNLFEKNLTGKIHWIKTVKVRWALPGKVNIYVIERTPCILVKQNGSADQWFTCDEKGMVLYEAPSEDQSKFPRLIINGNLAIGKLISENDISSALTLYKELPEIIKNDVNAFLVEENGEVIILAQRLEKPFKIKVGKVKNLKPKMERLSAIISMINEKSIAFEYIDLRFNEPVILPISDKPKTPVKEKSKGEENNSKAKNDKKHQDSKKTIDKPKKTH
jgi:cell division protein FtsQ